MYSEENEGKRLFGADNTMGLFVALYLILLAFFIVLTSVSNHAAARGAAAMSSVNDTFKKDGISKKANINPHASDDASNDPVLRALQNSFLSELELEGRFSEAGGGSFEVEFPESMLFQPGSFRVRQNMTPFLDQLLKIVVDADSVARHEVAIMFGAGVGSVDREPTRSQEIAIRRAGSLARYLQNAGFEQNRFTTGFVGIPEGQVLAVFYRDIEADKKSTLGTGAGGAP